MLSGRPAAREPRGLSRACSVLLGAFAAVLLGCLTASAVRASPYFDYDVVVEEGGTGPRIIFSAGSINDYGDIVYGGYDPTLVEIQGGTHVIEVDRTGTTSLVGAPYAPLSGAESLALINNDSDVLFYSISKFGWTAPFDGEKVTPFGDLIVWLTFVDASVWSYSGSTRSGTKTGSTDYFSFPITPSGNPLIERLPEFISTYVSMNDAGQWVYGMGDGDPLRPNKADVPELSFATKGLSQGVRTLGDVIGNQVVFEGSASLDPFEIASFRGANGAMDNLRPVIANDGTVLIREGTKTDSPIAVYPGGGNRFVIADTEASEKVAFTKLYESVAISDTGDVAVFAGDRGKGDGLFLSVRDGTEFTALGVDRPEPYINIVGEGQPDLGFGAPLVDGDTSSRARRFEEFDFEEGLFVLHFENAAPGEAPGTDDGLANDSIIVAFMGRPNAELILYPDTPPSPRLYRDTMGLWTVRIDLVPNPADGEIVPRIGSPIPVMQVGDALDGIIVDEIQLLDPLAKALTDKSGADRTDVGRADHRLVFRVDTSTDFSRLVRAERLDTDADGLADHWEEVGIDMDQDGLVDLDLPRMGATKDHKDVFLQIDFVSPRQLGVPTVYSHDLQPGVTQRLVGIYEAAPVQNPDGENGIRLHIDAGPDSDEDGVPYSNLPEPDQDVWGGYNVGATPGTLTPSLDYVYLGFEEDENVIGGLSARSLQSVKAESFGRVENRARELAFHYALMSEFITPVYRKDTERRTALVATVASATDEYLIFTERLPDGVDDKAGLKVIVGNPNTRGQVREYQKIFDFAVRVTPPFSERLAAGSTVVFFEGNGGVTEWVRGHGIGSLPVGDQIVSLRAFGITDKRAGNTQQQWSTLLHELGHNLGLVHCGTSEDADDCDEVTGDLRIDYLDARVLIEGDRDAQMLVSLSHPPDAPVGVKLETTDPMLVIEPASFSIGPGSWETGVTVTLRYPDDGVREEAPVRNAQVDLFASSTDTRFIDRQEQTQFSLFDNDQAELAYLRIASARKPGKLDPTLPQTDPDSGEPLYVYRTEGPLLFEGGGPPFPVTLRLTRQPSADVTVSFDTAGTTVTPDTLQFGASTWREEKTIRISASDNAVANVYLKAAFESEDPEYQGLSRLYFSPDHIDDDELQIRVELPFDRIILNEETEEAATTRVSLSRDPGREVPVLVWTASPKVAISSDSKVFERQQLLFDSTNWDEPQNLTLTASQNEDADGRTFVDIFYQALIDDGPVFDLRIRVDDTDALEEDHLSTMSYAHSYEPDFVVPFYSGPDTPRIDEWNALAFDLGTTLRSVGFATIIDDNPARPLDMSVDDYVRIFGRLPDVGSPDLRPRSPSSDAAVVVGSRFECAASASDAENAIESVRCVIDADGDGVLEEDEQVILEDEGFDGYTALSPPISGPPGPREVTFIAIDRASNRARTTLAVEIVAENTPPVASDLAFATSVDTPVALRLVGSDANATPVTFEVVTPPVSGTLTGTAPTLTYTPDPGFSGFDSLTYRVSDGSAQSNVATVQLMVGDRNEAPVLEPIPQIRVVAGATRRFKVRATDADGTSLRFNGDVLPEFVRLEPGDDGEATIILTPFLEDVGDYNALVSVSDAFASASRAFTIDVVPLSIFDDPPVIEPIDDPTVNVGSVVEIPVEASDPEDGAISLDADVPGFVTFSLSAPGSGTLTISPQPGDEGRYDLRVFANDGLATSVRIVSLTVGERDVVPPGLVATFPAAGDTALQGLDSAWVLFSEPIDLSTVDAGDITLQDEFGLEVSGLDLQWIGGNRLALPRFDPLAPGDYRLEVDFGGFGDVFGNIAGPGFASSVFSVLGLDLGESRPDTQRVYPVEEAARVLAVGDFDGDGITDAVASHGSAGPNGMAVFLGQGGGRFEPPLEIAFPDGSELEISANARSAPLVVGDINDDGLDDVIAGIETSLFVFLADPATVLADPIVYDASGFGIGSNPDAVGQLALADVTGDDLPDLLASMQRVLLVFPNEGSGSFGSPLSQSSSTQVGRFKFLATGLLDGDEFVDVVDGPNVLLGNGDGSFDRNLIGFDSSSTAAIYRHIAIADIDGDDINDIAGVNFASRDRVLRYSRGNGDGTFHTISGTGAITWNISEYTLPGNLIEDLLVADFDGDDAPDFVVEYRPDRLDNDIPAIGVFRNVGGGDFLQVADLPTVNRFTSPVAADLDGDGVLDLGHLAGDAFGVYPALGPLNLVPFDVTEVGQLDDFAAGDYDGDGDFDVAINDRSRDLVFLYENDGSGGFSEGLGYTFTRFPVVSILDVQRIALEDVNDDGNADLVAGGTDTIGVRLSNGDGRFGLAQRYPGRAVTDLHFADLDGDDALDIVGVDRTFYSVLLSNGDGTFTESASPTEFLSGAEGTAVEDATGDGLEDLVVANGSTNSVTILAGTGDGAFVPTGDPLFRSVDVALGSLGEIYVADQGGARAQKYSPTGELLFTFAEFGSGPGGLNSPRSIAVDSTGNVYVADDFDDRVVKYDANGSYLLEFGTLGSGPGDFDRPWALAIDASDRIHVVDKSNDRVQVFDSNGGLLREFGAGVLANPEDIAIDSAGRVYVLDIDNLAPDDAAIRVFDASGAFVDEWSALGQDPAPLVHRPLGIAIDAADLVYVSEGFGSNDTHRVQVFTTDGAYLRGFGRYGSLLGQLWEPRGLTVDSIGRVLVATRLGVERFDASGVVIDSIGSGLRVAGGPRGVAVADLDGDDLPDLITSNGVGVRRGANEPDLRSDDSGAHTVSVLFARAEGGYEPHYDCQVGRDPSQPVVLDLNGDGRLDVATWSDRDHTVTVLLGGEGGRFAGRVDLRVDDLPIRLEVGPVDGDALPDLLTGSLGEDTLTTVLNDPSVWQQAHPADCTLPALPPTGGGAPIADAGADQSVLAGDAVILDGTGSAPGGASGPLAFAWRQVGGAAVDLIGANASQPVFEAGGVDLLEFELTVSAGGESAVDRVWVVVDPAPPTNASPQADAGPDQVLALPAVALLDGRASSDPDGDPLSFEWRVVVAPLGATAVVANPGDVETSLAIDGPGTYVVALVVDDGIATASDTVVIEADANFPPIAVAAGTTEVLLPAAAFLDGTGGADANLDPLTYRWRVVEQPEGATALIADPSAAATSLALDLAGPYLVELVVNDGTSDSAPSLLEIIARSNQPPVARAGTDRRIELPGSVALDGRLSFDPDGDAISYGWTLASAPPGAAAILTGEGTATPTLTPDRPGTYELELIVTDGAAASPPDRVTILASGDDPPIASAGPDRSVLLPAAVILDGRGSADPERGALEFEWRLESTPPGASPTLGGADGALAALTADTPGPYVVRLVVRDPAGNAASDTTTIVVTANLPPTASAGPDASASPGTLVELDGSASTDPDGSPLPLSSLWRFTSLPPESALIDELIEDRSLLFARFTPDVAGVYELEHIVQDGADDARDQVQITVTGEVEPPEPIADLRARAKSGKINLVWTPVTGATYDVFRRATTEGPYELIAEGHVSDHAAYADFGLTNGTTYAYVVTVVVDGVSSAPSNQASATPGDRDRGDDPGEEADPVPEPDARLGLAAGLTLLSALAHGRRRRRRRPVESK